MLNLKHRHDREYNETTEIIVVDGNPEGNTIDQIQRSEVITLTSPKGRAVQMNRGAKIATGKTLLFLHADTTLPINGLKKITDTMNHGKYVGGAFNLVTKDLHWFQKHLYHTHYLRSKLSRIPYGDQAIFISKSYFHQLGGYREIPLMEDVDLMKRVKRNKGNICILEDRVFSSTRRYDEEGMFYCWFRNNKIRILYFFGVPPEKLARWYPDTRRRKAEDEKKIKEIFTAENAENTERERMENQKMRRWKMKRWKVGKWEGRKVER